MGKYDALAGYLRSSETSPVRIGFADLERVVGVALPESARKYTAWWRGQNVDVVAASIGWRMGTVDLKAETVTFEGPIGGGSVTVPSMRLKAPPKRPEALFEPAPPLPESVLDIEALMRSLAAVRPLFHSEADFQHALAWIIRESHSDARIRLETRPRRALHLDLDVTVDGHRIAIELKYFVKATNVVIDGEVYEMPGQSAHDIGRYDLIKDIWRVEQLVADDIVDEGWAIALANDSAYWRPGTKVTPIDVEFRIHEGSTLRGTRSWHENAGKGTMEGRSAPLPLVGEHTCRWRQYESGHEELALRWIAFHAK